MVKHIVFWRLKDEHEGRTKVEIAMDIKDALEEMSKHVPTVKHFEVGIGTAREDMTSDIALYSEFEDWDGLKVYQDHPEHVKFKEFVKDRRTERRVVDYEV